MSFSRRANKVGAKVKAAAHANGCHHRGVKRMPPLWHGVEVQVEEGSAGGYVEDECREEE